MEFENAKINDLLLFNYDDEENEKIYIVTDISSSYSIKTRNLLTGEKKSVNHKYVDSYTNLGNLSDRLILSQKL